MPANLPALSGPAVSAAWTLRVTAGPHSGAVVPLAPGRYRLGSESGNEIVLADSDVAARQAVLTIGSREAAVEALAPGIDIRGRSLRQNHHVKLSRPTALTAGATEFRLEGGTRRTRGSRIALLAAIPVTLAAAVATAAAQLLPPPDPHATVAPPVQAATTIQTDTLDVATQAMAAHLAQSGVGTVRVSPAGGAVLAEGALPPEQHALWTEAQMWYDSHYANRFALIDHVGADQPNDQPHLAIRAVATAPVPYIICQSGDRYMEGAVIDGGWTIQHITSRRIVLARSGQTIDINL